MSQPAARLTDMHTCPMSDGPKPHVGGPVTGPGCATVLIAGLPAARVSDLATCVGPPDTIIKGAPTTLIAGLPAARLGDQTAHGGVIVAGCPTVLIGGSGGAGGAPSSPSPSSPEAKGPTEPAEAPVEKTWLGVELKDPQGLPLANQDFRITLENGQVVSGRTDANGLARFEEVERGRGRAGFPNIPAPGR